jgi:hypothetical protein
MPQADLALIRVWINGWIPETSDQLQVRLLDALRSLFDQPAILQPECRPNSRL